MILNIVKRPGWLAAHQRGKKQHTRAGVIDAYSLDRRRRRGGFLYSEGASFPTLKGALVAPLIWIFVTTLEGQFITPTIIGHRQSLNPFLVFLSIAFWAWMWGPLGAFLAVPLVISFVVLERHLFSYSEVRSRKRTSQRPVGSEAL